MRTNINVVGVQGTRGLSAETVIYGATNYLVDNGESVVIGSGANANRSITEILNYHIHIDRPELGILMNKSRKISYKLIVAEFLMYVTGWCKTAKECGLLTYLAPKYSSFLNEEGTFDGYYGEHISPGIEMIITLLRKDTNSRQAVIPIYDSGDLERARYGLSKDISCTENLQFLIRNNKLHMIVNMRSSDALWGLPHDTGSFTLIQRFLAEMLGTKLGTFSMNLGSFHFYDEMKDKVQDYLESDTKDMNDIRKIDFTGFRDCELVRILGYQRTFRRLLIDFSSTCELELAEDRQNSFLEADKYWATQHELVNTLWKYLRGQGIIKKAKEA